MYHPTREEFRRRAARGNLIPVYRRVLLDMDTPVSAFLKIRRGPYAFLLESVEGGETLGRYSFLASEPSLVLKARGSTVEILRRGVWERRSLEAGEDPLTVLAQLLGQYRFVGSPDLPPFCGGAVGYMSYDLVRFFERLPEKTEDDLGLPDCVFAFTDTLLVFDHVQHHGIVLHNARVEDDPDAAYDQALERIDEVVARLRAAPPAASPGAGRTGALTVRSNLTPHQFEEAVRAAKEYIAAGDIIQVVLSQRLAVDITAPPFDLYRALRSINPSPYMYYLHCDDLILAGSSPEILVTEKQGQIRLRPIAGTRRRGVNEEEDRALMEELLADEKERAEHIMLVDLGRNDVGRVSEFGSVQVDELMVIEKYSHVMHLVSNVVGSRRPDCNAFDVLRACFPAGTVSGAPKIRAMEIIEELEPTRRGPYAGAIGYFSYSGSMDTCITIRTILVRDGTAYIQVGAGIVADSVPEREYQECANKARALLAAIEMAEQGLDS